MWIIQLVDPAVMGVLTEIMVTPAIVVHLAMPEQLEMLVIPEPLVILDMVHPMDLQGLRQAHGRGNMAIVVTQELQLRHYMDLIHTMLR
jgi:hypothetical protein